MDRSRLVQPGVAPVHKPATPLLHPRPATEPPGGEQADDEAERAREQAAQQQQ